MSQIGSGFGSGFPLTIDTVQTWRNGSTPFPDSDTRLDAEGFNDFALAIRALQVTLGANPQGIFGSVAARLNQFLPGTVTVTSLLSFVNAMAVTLPGSVHQLGTAAVLTQLYDQNAPAQAIEGDAEYVDPSTYDITVSFVTPQSGVIIAGASAPLYATSFVAQTTVTILGITHGLGTPLLLYQVQSDVHYKVQPARVTVHPSTFDVVLYFNDALTGSVVLSAAGPRYSVAFTSATSVTIPGTTHLLGSRALLYQVWDAQTPREAVEPDSVRVDAATYDVVVAFAQPQSGTLVLAVAGQIAGSDFEIRDGGIPNATAARVYSEVGSINVQEGAGDHFYVRTKTGAPIVTVDGAGHLGLGTTSPGYQLTLSTDSAAKPATSAWTVSSDERLKDVLREFTDGLNVVLALHSYVYRYNGKGGIPRDGKEQIGLIAQDVQPIAPYMVSSHRGQLTPDEDETDILDFQAHSLTHVLVNAVQQLHAQIVILEQERDALREDVARLMAAVFPIAQEEPHP